MNDPINVFITFRLAPELVEKVQTAHPRINITYEPDLLGQFAQVANFFVTKAILRLYLNSDLYVAVVWHELFLWYWVFRFQDIGVRRIAVPSRRLDTGRSIGSLNAD